jgi:two-component system response regulator PilR (NtrC family)
MTASESLSTKSGSVGDPGANRVLVVDDDITQRAILVRILRKGNYESARAMSSLEARSLLETSSFGLVVTDLRMFAENGIELVRHVRDHHPETSSIVVSGFASKDDIDRIHQAGAFDLIVKPVEQELFLEMVGKAFEDRAQKLARATSDRADAELRQKRFWIEG